MQFENEFVVPVAPPAAWQVLMDMEQVARCMPGATLLENDGQRFAGKVKVKVGPIAVGYRGAAEFVEKDETAFRAVLRASGREERGAGTAGATVTAQLHPAGENRTRVHVLTDLDITGKPAQFGRGVMAEVGTAIIGQFATRLAGQIGADGAGTVNGAAAVNGAAPVNGAVPAAPAAPAPTAPARTASGDDNNEGDALDMGLLVGRPVLKRFAPVVAGVLALLALSRVLTRSGRQAPVVVVFGQVPRGWSPESIRHNS